MVWRHRLLGRNVVMNCCFSAVPVAEWLLQLRGWSIRIISVYLSRSGIVVQSMHLCEAVSSCLPYWLMVSLLVSRPSSIS